MTSSSDGNSSLPRPARRETASSRPDRPTPATYPQCLADQPARSPGTGGGQAHSSNSAPPCRMPSSGWREMSCASSPRSAARQWTHWHAERSSWAASMATARRRERTQEVGQTLQTALGDPEIADLLRAGRLTQAVTYGGFGPTDLASALGASLPTKAPSQPAKPVAAEPAAAMTRSSVAKPKRQRRRPGSGQPPRVRPRRQRRRRLRQPPSARMSWPTRSSRCAASCARRRPPSERLVRRREPRGSTIRSCAKPPLRPSRWQLRQTRPSLSEA